MRRPQVGTKLPTEPPYSGPKLTYRQQVKLKIEYATVQGQSVSEFKAAAKSGAAALRSFLTTSLPSTVSTSGGDASLIGLLVLRQVLLRWLARR